MNNRFKNEILNIPEIYKISFDVYKKNFLYVAFMSILSSAPMIILMGLMKESMYDLLLLLTDYNVVSNDEAYRNVLIKVFSQTFITVFFGFISQASAVYITKYYLENKKIKFENIFEVSILKLHKFTLTGLLYYLVIISVIILIFPAIYYGVIFYFAIFINALSDNYGFKALFESQKLVFGYFWKTLALLLVNFIFENILQSVLSLIFSSFAENQIAIFFINIFANILYMLFLIAAAVWMFNIYHYKVNQINNIVNSDKYKS